jgi:hypothetical protein
MKRSGDTFSSFSDMMARAADFWHLAAGLSSSGNWNATANRVIFCIELYETFSRR